jgi:hypothetical protein
MLIFCINNYLLHIYYTKIIHNLKLRTILILTFKIQKITLSLILGKNYNYKNILLR